MLSHSSSLDQYSRSVPDGEKEGAYRNKELTLKRSSLTARLQCWDEPAGLDEIWDGFLDASSHLYNRVCPSIRPSVRPLVRPSVRPSVRRSRIRKKQGKSIFFEQISVRGG